MGGIIDKIFEPVPIFEIALAMNSPKKLAETLERSASAARTTAAFIGDQKAAEALEGGADALDDIAGHINTGLKIHSNYKAVVGIYLAWKEIDPGSISQNPQRAALAFGSLFANVGVLAENLPPPLNVYAEFLAGFENFFSDMQKKLDIESPHYPKGRALRQVMERDEPL